MTTEHFQANMVVDVNQAAKILQVHRDTVRALIRCGRLHAKRLGRQRAIRIPLKSIEAFLASEDE